jgi:hypothetical protein
MIDIQNGKKRIENKSKTEAEILYTIPLSYFEASFEARPI